MVFQTFLIFLLAYWIPCCFYITLLDFIVCCLLIFCCLLHLVYEYVCFASAFRLSLILKTSQSKIIFYKIANNEVEILERLWAIILIWLYLVFKENWLVNCVMNCFVVYLTPIIVFSQILHVFFEVSEVLKN